MAAAVGDIFRSNTPRGLTCAPPQNRLQARNRCILTPSPSEYFAFSFRAFRQIPSRCSHFKLAIHLSPGERRLELIVNPPKIPPRQIPQHVGDTSNM
jgi:hypothetical protein